MAHGADGDSTVRASARCKKNKNRGVAPLLRGCYTHRGGVSTGAWAAEERAEKDRASVQLLPTFLPVCCFVFVFVFVFLPRPTTNRSDNGQVIGAHTFSKLAGGSTQGRCRRGRFRSGDGRLLVFFLWENDLQKKCKHFCCRQGTTQKRVFF